MDKESSSTSFRIMDHLNIMNESAELGGGKARIKAQHAKGKKTARERIDLLLDKGSFVEIDRFVLSRQEEESKSGERHYGDGVVTGYGKIEGRIVFIFSHDFTVFGGSLGEMFGRKVTKVMDLSMKAGAPLIGLNDSGGARIQEGVQSLAAYSEIFFRNTLASGVIPQISAILGPCAGGAVYSPAMTDFVFMVEHTSNMFITGPDVVKAALGQEVTFEQLGGADLHATKSGVAHFVSTNEEECFQEIRKLLSFLPCNNSQFPPVVEGEDSPTRVNDVLENIIPSDSSKPYDMKSIIEEIVDNHDFMEVHSRWAPNIIVGLARFNGGTVGIVANQPLQLAGALDIDSSNKAARFIRFCDSFNIPVITLVDVPGYMPGLEQESGGIIRHGSKLLYAYCEAAVPKITIVTRKAYGGAYCAMGSKYSRADLNWAWPTAQLAVMGPEGAVKILHQKELGSQTESRFKEEAVKEYTEKFLNPFIAAERGIIDGVIMPKDTRAEIIRALELLSDKNEQRPAKKHGNIQL
jgi:acetyl-CoA carboxylase carboxyltransferase component